MAARISPKNIAILVAAVSSVVLALLYLAPGTTRQPALTPQCTPLPENIVFVGPAQTIAEVERSSRAEMNKAPTSVPRAAFGHQNARWVELKASAKPGDTVHEFRTAVSGGHLILRGQCVVGHLPGWVR